jgi:hypothetical protein
MAHVTNLVLISVCGSSHEGTFPYLRPSQLKFIFRDYLAPESQTEQDSSCDSLKSAKQPAQYGKGLLSPLPFFSFHLVVFIRFSKENRGKSVWSITEYMYFKIHKSSTRSLFREAYRSLVNPIATFCGSLAL